MPNSSSRSCGEVIGLRLVARGQADDALDFADVAVAGQVAEERGQLLIDDLRDADDLRRLLCMHGAVAGPARTAPTSGGQSSAVPSATPRAVADDRFDIDPGRLRDVCQGQRDAAASSPVRRPFCAQRFGPAADANAVADGRAHRAAARSRPAACRRCVVGAFQLQAAPRADHHRFSIFELRPVVDGRERLAVAHADRHAACIDDVSRCGGSRDR